MQYVFGRSVAFVSLLHEMPSARPVQMPVLAEEVAFLEEVKKQVALRFGLPRLKRSNEQVTESRQSCIVAWRYMLMRSDMVSKTGGFMKAESEEEVMRQGGRPSSSQGQAHDACSWCWRQGDLVEVYSLAS